jgi:hypothetical protein
MDVCIIVFIQTDCIGNCLWFLCKIDCGHKTNFSAVYW